MSPSDSSSWNRRLWPAAAFQFALIAGVTQLKSAANALVLSRFESQAMPYLYLLGALITAALTLLPRSKPNSPLESPGVLTGVGGVLTLGFALALSAGYRTPALGLYLFVDTFSTFVSFRFWARMSAAFDAREARKAFTALNGFAMGGGMVGGLLVQRLAERLGTPAMVVSGALGLLAAGAIFHHLYRGEPPPSAPQGRSAPASFMAFSYLATSPYAQVLAALGISFAVLSAFVDYLFRLRLEGTMSEDAMAALFGSLQLYIGLFCVAFQLLLTQRLLKRLGLLGYVALVPLVIVPLAAASLITPSLWPLHLLRLLETAVNYSILPVGIQLLYAAVPDGQREGLRAAVDGLLRKGGVVVAGLLLIGAGRAATGETMALAVVGMCAALVGLLVRLKPAYVAALGEQVGAHEEEAVALEGEEDQRLLAEALSAPVPDRVLRAVDLMEQAQVSLRPHLPALLRHPHERVLERGVALALELDARELAPVLERLVEEGPRRPRDQAVWALARLSPERAERLLPALLNHPDIGLRCAAIGALVKSTGSAVALASLEELLARGEGAPVMERREVAKLLGRLQDSRFTGPLARYLEDSDGTVRRVALAAVGEGGYVELAPRLLPFLTWREERKTTREALVALGDAVTPLVEEQLNNRRAPLAMRLQLPRVLRGIGTPAALDALLFSNVRDDASLHFRIGAQLSRLRDEHPEHPVDVDRVRDALIRRRDVYRSLVGAYRDVRAALGDGSLLTRAVGDRLDQALELSFFLLGLLDSSQRMRGIHYNLVGQDARRRALALELLDNLLSEEDRELVMEQVEAHHRELPLGASGRLWRRLAALVQSEDVVLRACARQVARVNGLDVLPQEGELSDRIVQRMFALEGVSVFSQSDVDDIAAIAAVAREGFFRAGERIYAQGDPGDALYVIVDGAIDAFHDGEHVLRFQGKQAFGEVSLLDGAPRPTDMVAAVDTRVLIIDRRDFLDLLADRPELLTGFFRAVSLQLQALIALPDSRETGERLEMTAPQPPVAPPLPTGPVPDAPEPTTSQRRTRGGDA
ncbi:HEAT-like repeat-containing cyclic nucleotide-binding domain-containing PBS lyase [Myxococcus stipitatus DSM 14675]|uniref:HEAT-like repeat-containing cyclic nucleotide-binding domain-containing PBS lyase n=1 Tax=Myxococcus stipitatus (strain DSM 14675 / JCM 12634 / Mx s8) TaxID=1278073 RepID=L7U8L0_MYXSD|nr:cyclic nucleotide-binding domain-containing protein [Myxococcus stipitatus]AGC44170.1 HEAT-like repeat-containing cyclic nucleotide-binding domain-containing PBS lyase [Myxococcus stipitatus DSM 14675]